MGKSSKLKPVSVRSQGRLDSLAYLSQAILKSTGAGIYISREGKFLYVSPLIEEYSDYTKNELLGKYCLDLVFPEDREYVRTMAIKNLKDQLNNSPYEYRFISKKGHQSWVLEKVTSIEYGGERAVLGSIMDITEKKRIEEEFSLSEEKFSTILERMQDGYYELDLTGNFTYANFAASNILGYTREELVGKNYRLVTPLDEHKKLFMAFNEVYVTNIPNRAFSHRFLQKGGGILFAESSIDLCRDAKGQVTGFRCISRDITERKQMEEVLLRSEQRFRTIIERMQDAYYELDLKGNYTFTNNAVTNAFGYSRAEMIGMNYRQIVPAEDVRNIFRAYNDVYRTGISSKGLTHRCIRKDGTAIFIESTIDLQTNEAGEVIGFRTVSRDITERKALEEELRQSEEKYRNILKEMEDAYYEVDRAGNFTFVNDSTCREMIYTRNEILGMNYRKATYRDDIEAVYKAFNQVYRTGKPNRAFSHRMVSKDGTVHFVEASISPLKNKQGEIIGFRCVSRDVTERKQLEEALSRSEETYRNILEQMQDAYYEIDVAGNFLFANEATCRSLGLRPVDLMGTNYNGFIPEDERPSVMNVFKSVLNTGTPNRGFAHRVILPNGSSVFAEVSISPLRDKQNTIIGFRCVSRDVTERKQMEQIVANMATHDFLTELPNRVLLIDRFEIAQAQAQRNEYKLAVMSLDLDRFKEVNDNLGHSVGDVVLKQVALKLSSTVRASDTVARLGGDEFLLLLQEIHELQDATTIAEKVLHSVKEPIIIGEDRLTLSASIGIATYPDDGTDLEMLMKKSDASMYYSKRHGGNQYKVHYNTERG